MDILQHTWSQIGLFIALQLLYLELSTVNSFAWHTPSQSHSRTIPAASHLISQRWHHSVPKWYPYTMWKRGKRKNDNLRDLIRDNSIVFRKLHPMLHLGSSGQVSKYRAYFEKINTERKMNMVARDGFLNQHYSQYGGSLNSKAVKLYGRSSGKSSTSLSHFLPRKYDYNFGNIGSIHKTLLASNTQDLSQPKEEKKFTGTSTGSKDAAIGPMVSGAFYSFGGFKPMAPDDGFSDGFVPVSSPPTDAKETDVIRADKGLGEGGFTSDASIHIPKEDTGSWGDDGFGMMDASASSSVGAGSWEDRVQTDDGFGSFSDNTKDCDTILSKSCTHTTQCSCYGFYECSKQKCIPLKSPDSGSSLPAAGSMWHDGPVDFDLSKRNDPSKVIQIYMLPWKPEK